ncbi:MAG: glycosyltransferase [Eggerthellaceae bacterium]|nr:glycosyltransferase [Eggerthellaceae bacterium]
MPTTFKDLKVALVHDWLVGRGGGERVLYDIHTLFPDAPIYTLVYDQDKAPEWCKECDIRTTYIQKWPGAKSHHKLLLSFMPKAWEALDLTEYDLVISCCASCCKGVITRPDALHVCYSFSPTRYVWDLYYDYLENTNAIKRFFMKRMIHKVRLWDFQAAQRVDHFAADSNFVGSRIKKYYRRDFTTIYPGTRINEYPITEMPDDYYLVVARFVRYKRVYLAIEACKQLKKKLVVIGWGGEEEERLKKLAGDTVEFLGRVSDEEMERYYSRAKAFLFPGIEDYGITPVEAMSAGVPVLAFGKGGALETVQDGKTGLYFHDQTVSGLVHCIEEFERNGVAYSRQQIHDYSLNFSDEIFKGNFTNFLKDKLIECGQGQKISERDYD